MYRVLILSIIWVMHPSTGQANWIQDFVTEQLRNERTIVVGVDENSAPECRISKSTIESRSYNVLVPAGFEISRRSQLAVLIIHNSLYSRSTRLCVGNVSISVQKFRFVGQGSADNVVMSLHDQAVLFTGEPSGHLEMFESGLSQLLIDFVGKWRAANSAASSHR